MATEVGKGYVGISPDFKGFGSEVNQGVAGETGGIKSAFGKLGGLAAAAFKIGAAAAIAGGAVFIKDAIGEASDLNESTTKVQAVFKKTSPIVLEWGKTTAKSLGQSKQAAIEAASTYGNLFQAFGLGEEKAVGMSVGLTNLATDLASFNNTSVQDAVEALRSGLTGETEPLKRYGVALSDVRLKQQALDMGLIKSTKDALTPAVKAQAAYALVMHDTILAQGDFGRTSGGLANQQRILAAQFTDLKANIGAALLPAFLSFVTFLNEKLIPALPKIGEFLKTHVLEPAQEVVAWIGAHWRGAFEFLTGNSLVAAVRSGFGRIWPVIVDGAKTAVNWLVEHWPDIREGFGSALQAIADAWQKYGIPTFHGLQEAVRATVEFVKSVWPSVKDAFVVAFGAIMDAGQATVDWFKDQWQGITTAALAVATFFSGPVWQAMQNAWDKILQGAQGVVNWFKTNWDQISETVQNVFTIVKTIVIVDLAIIIAYIRTWIEIITTIWHRWGDDIMQVVRGVWMEVVAIISTVLGVIRGLIAVFADLLRGDWGAVWNDLKGIVSTVWNGIVDQIAGFLTIISGLIGAAWDGIKGITNTAWTAMKSVVGTAIDGIVDFVSKLPGRARDVLGDLLSTLVGKGNDLIGGFLKGITDKFADVVTFIILMPGKIVDSIGDTTKKLFSVGYDIIKGFWDGIKSALSNLIGTVKIPLPKVPDWVPIIGGKGGGFLTLAEGGLVKARPGGTPAILGERGHDELVIPLPRFGQSSAMSAAVAAGTGAVVIHIHGNVLGDENAIARVILPALRKGTANGFGRAA